MSGFANPGLLALAGLAAAPLIIHLLFRVRPPVVRWPAMDFLLAAMRKTRRRTRLEQFVLLALRMGLIGLAAVLVARPRVGDELTAMVGSGPAAEHVVVLDDTLSMREIVGAETAFDAATLSMTRMVNRLADRPGRNRLAVIETSRPGQFLIPPTVLDAERAVAIGRELENAKASYLAQSPDAALERAVDQLAASDASVRMLHVLSDFRARDWAADGAALKTLRRAGQAGSHLRLVDVAPTAETERRPNIAVNALAAATGPIAAGVPVEIEATISNSSDRAAEDVTVDWRLDGQAMPRTKVNLVPPRGTATARTTVTPREPGLKVLTAKTPADRLPADDERWLALDVVDRAPVLVIDGDERQRDGRFLAAALDPGGNARTGWAPTLRPLETVRRPGLSRFRAILFANVPEFSADDASALTAYVLRGGAVGWFVGEQVPGDGWKTLATVKLLPAVLRGSEASPRRTGAGGEVVVAGEFLKGLAHGKSSLLDDVSVTRRFAIKDRLPEGANVLLAGQDGKPLALSRPVGLGKTALVLTTAGSTWNNWATNPSYVVFVLELCSYLTASRGDGAVVGERWREEIDATELRRSGVWRRMAEGAAAEQPLTTESVGGAAVLSTPSIDVPGVYRMTLQTLGGEKAERGRAFNVDQGESDLKKASVGVFSAALEGTSYRMETAGAEAEEGPSTATEVDGVLVGLLLALLFAEQAWARRCNRQAG